MGTTLRAPTLGNTVLLLWNEKEEALWQWRGVVPQAPATGLLHSAGITPALWEPQGGDIEDSIAAGSSPWDSVWQEQVVGADHCRGRHH